MDLMFRNGFHETLNTMCMSRSVCPTKFSRISNAKLKRVVGELPFDCWSHVLLYLEACPDFCSLCLSVNHLLSYVQRVNPCCLKNISFEVYARPCRPKPFVKKLKLINNVVESDEVRTLFPNVETFDCDVSSCRTGEERLFSFIGLTSVEQANVHVDVETEIGGLPLLKSLCCRQKCVGAGFELKCLDVFDVPFLCDLQVSFFEICLRDLVVLRRLELCNVHVDGSGICGLERLEELTICGKNNIFCVSGLPLLRRLCFRPFRSVSFCRDVDVGVEELTDLPSLTDLEITRLCPSSSSSSCCCCSCVVEGCFCLGKICNVLELRRVHLENVLGVEWTQNMFLPRRRGPNGLLQRNSDKILLQNAPNLTHLSILFSSSSTQQEMRMLFLQQKKKNQKQILSSSPPKMKDLALHISPSSSSSSSSSSSYGGLQKFQQGKRKFHLQLDQTNNQTKSKSLANLNKILWYSSSS